MKRSALRRTTPLDRSSRPLERSKPLNRGEGPKRTNGKPVAGTGVRARAISPASRPQKMKVRAEGRCRRCGAPESVTTIHPAHVIDRSLGGCNEPLCVLPLCAICHAAYDEGRIDLLPLATYEEQGHAAMHVGLVGALRRITNDREAAR